MIYFSSEDPEIVPISGGGTKAPPYKSIETLLRSFITMTVISATDTYKWNPILGKNRKPAAKNAKTKKKVVDLAGFIGYTILA